MKEGPWYRLFLEERPSIGLSFFRIFVALTVGFHVLPGFVHLGDTYLPTAFKTYNLGFFTPGVIELVQRSPDVVVVAFVWLFCIFWFLFLIGLWSQLSCVLMTLACYYFYALNSYHVGTLSWDILLVTLFLMCLTPYHGDYFSVDCLLCHGDEPYRRRRPFFIQRLLQIQIGFTYFFTALYKIYPSGNWLTDNPMYYLMNYPPPGVTKYFLLREFFMHQPQLCYWLGITVVLIEFAMPFLLFCPRTRISAIYLGLLFHITLILTLDVPATFFFLFSPQLLLFINPERILAWIEKKRAFNQAAGRSRLIYDGGCRFCRASLHQLKTMDLFAVLTAVDFHQVDDLKAIHPDLTREKALSQLHLIEPDGRLYGGFEVFRRICFSLPMLYPLILLFYFPGMGILGPLFYRFIAKNRYFFHWNATCRNNACFR